MVRHSCKIILEQLNEDNHIQNVNLGGILLGKRFTAVLTRNYNCIYDIPPKTITLNTVIPLSILHEPYQEI